MDDARALRERLKSGDEDEQFDALTDIGKRRVRGLEADVVPFLAHPSAELRGAAARTLGFHLRVLSELEPLRRLSVEDPDAEVRQAAIFGWTTLLSGTRDSGAMRQLEGWLRDRAQPYPVRAASFWGLLDVAGLPRARWPAPRAFRDIDAEVPWALVAEALGGSGGT